MFLSCLVITAGAMHTSKYLAAGDVSVAKKNIHDFLWQAPRLIEEHSRTVAVDAGSRMATVIRSWYPEVELKYIKDGYFPETTDEQGHHQIADSTAVVGQVVAKVNM